MISLVGDEGAQFVQHLLGLRTVVFVGCGATMDDPNIALLIRFMGDWLDTEVPYYYLLRSDDALPLLPANVHPIVYGDSFDDLPSFLDELASLKLVEARRQSPLVGRVYESEGRDSSGLCGISSYHFSADEIPFIGREAELELLESFLDEDATFSRACLIGQGGAGKSRLAYELMGRHRFDWFCFFASVRADSASAESFFPFANTLVVFDCVRGREGRIAGALRSLYASFAGSGFRLRVLFIEREVETGFSGWLRNLEGCLDGNIASDFARNEFCPPIILGDLSDREVSSLIAEVCRCCNLPADKARDGQLMEHYRRYDETLKFRPLYVRMYVEAWIANGRREPEYASFQPLIQGVLQREQEKWLGLFCGDYLACNAMIRLMVRACAGGPLILGELPGGYLQDWETVKGFISGRTFPGVQREEFQRALLAVSCHDIYDAEDCIAPEFPSVIKEYMLVYYVPAEDRVAFARELWENSGRQFSALLQRALKDFRENEALIEMMRAHPDPYEDSNVLLAHLAYIRKERVGEAESLDELGRQAEGEYAFWHDMPVLPAFDEEQSVLNLLKVQGLMLCGERFGAHSLSWEDMERSLSCCIEAAEVSLGELEGFKLLLLSDRAKLYACNGREDCAELLHGLMGRIEAGCEAEQGLINALKPYRRLLECNHEIMDFLLRGELYAALEKAKRVRSGVDFSDAEQVRLFCSSCHNIVKFSFLYRDQKRLDQARNMIETAVRAHPDDDALRALSLSAEVEQWQYRVLCAEESGEKARARIEEILAECEGLNHIKEFYDCWASAAIAYLNVCKEGSSLKSLSERAEALLCEDDSTGTQVAQAWMKIKIAEYEGKGSIPSTVVQRAHAYFLRQPESEGTRDAFFRLLWYSSERHKVSDYFDARARAAMLQDFLTNPLFSEEVYYQLMELGIDENMLESAVTEAGLMRDLPDDVGQPAGAKKPGRNDLCPCGSGKKFKKCCLGKGIYD